MAYRPVVIPEVVIGADVETKSVKPDAYVVSMALNAFDVETLKHIGCCYGTIDPNDENAKCFHEDAGTMSWWRGEGDPNYAPSREAFKEAFSGKDKLPDVLKRMVDFAEPLRRKHKVSVATRGPEFDIPIIRNALSECGLYEGIFRNFSANDSDRTAERVLSLLNMDIDHAAEEWIWVKKNEWVEHMPAFDSALSAYRTARCFHLCGLVGKYGSEVAREALELIRTNQYDAMKFKAAIEAKLNE